MGGKKFKQNLGWAAESARDSSLVSKTLFNDDLLCHGFVLSQIRFVTDLLRHHEKRLRLHRSDRERRSRQLPNLHGWQRITILIFNSQAQTLSDHTLFSDSQPYKVCSWLVRRRSSVREEYLVEIKCKRKIQKICRNWRERRAASPRTFTGVSQAKRFPTAANLEEIFYNFER